MGYETVYHLDCDGDSPTLTEVARLLALYEGTNAKEDRDWFFTQAGAVTESVACWERVLSGEEATLWYENEVEMARISRFWPEVTFILEGDGEQSDDLWRSYFQDGKVHAVEGRIVFTAFDPEQLRDPIRTFSNRGGDESEGRPSEGNG